MNITTGHAIIEDFAGSATININNVYVDINYGIIYFSNHNTGDSNINVDNMTVINGHLMKRPNLIHYLFFILLILWHLIMWIFYISMT